MFHVDMFAVLSCAKECIEELRDLYSSPSMISIIKSRRMRWVGHVAQMGENQRERDH
jgi:hypothetical protein